MTKQGKETRAERENSTVERIIQEHHCSIVWLQSCSPKKLPLWLFLRTCHCISQVVNYPHPLWPFSTQLWLSILMSMVVVCFKPGRTDIQYHNAMEELHISFPLAAHKAQCWVLIFSPSIAAFSVISYPHMEFYSNDDTNSLPLLLLQTQMLLHGSQCSAIILI